MQRNLCRGQIREIVIGKTLEKDIKEFSDWVFHNYQMNQQAFSTSVISINMKDFHIPLQDLKQIFDGEQEGKEIKIRNYSKDKKASLPSKLMLGDGIRWLALISLPIQQHNGSYHAMVSKLQPCHPGICHPPSCSYRRRHQRGH